MGTLGIGEPQLLFRPVQDVLSCLPSPGWRPTPAGHVAGLSRCLSFGSASARMGGRHTCGGFALSVWSSVAGKTLALPLTQSLTAAQAQWPG